MFFNTLIYTSKVLVGAPLAYDASGNKTGAVYSCNIDTKQCPEIQNMGGKIPYHFFSQKYYTSLEAVLLENIKAQNIVVFKKDVFCSLIFYEKDLI